MVIPNCLDNCNHTYQFCWFHLLTSILCMTIHAQKVSACLEMNVVLLNHHDDDDHPYSFELHHVLTSILYMTITEHKVSDTPAKMCLFQTIMTITTIHTNCIAFISSHQYSQTCKRQVFDWNKSDCSKSL